MGKAIILYASVHHGNTRKIAFEMAKVLSADVVDLTQAKDPDISSYDIVGLASGSYYGSMHEKIKAFANTAVFLPGQKVFLVCTCGAAYRDYTRGVKQLLKEKGVEVLGSFQCRGYDTFGPFKMVGGIAKGRPNEKDLNKARAFAEKLLEG